MEKQETAVTVKLTEQKTRVFLKAAFSSRRPDSATIAQVIRSYQAGAAEKQ